MSKNVVNASIENIYSLTSMQEGMLFHSIDNKRSSEYIVQNEFMMANDISVKKVKWVLKALALKHTVLRTAILYEELSKPRQVVLKERDIEFEEIDLSNYETNISNKKYESLKEDDVERKFDLQKDSLLRAKLFHFPDKYNKMIFTYHHIIMDGWSLSILYGDFVRYYTYLIDGMDQSSLYQLALDEKREIPDYGLYIKYLEKHDAQSDMDYWKNLLDGYEGQAEIHPIPSKRQEYKQLRKSEIILKHEITKVLLDVAMNHNLTISSILETAWAVTLAYYCNLSDVVFGKVISGRDISEIPNIEKVLGLFINTIPVRVKYNQSETIEQLIHEVKLQDLESLNHGHCALVDIQNQTQQKSRLFNSIFVHENYYVDSEFLSLSKNDKVSFEYQGGREQTNYPITVATKLEEATNELVLTVLYDANEFEDAEIHRLLDRIEKVLVSFAQDIYSKVNQISFLLEEEKELYHDINQTTTEYPMDQSVVKLFEEQVERNKNAIAVEFNQDSFTYESLNQRANQIANYLLQVGVGPNHVVGITAERALNLVPALLGIVKTGAAYLPLDLKNPRERTQNLLNESKCNIVLSFRSNVVYPEVTMINMEEWDGKDISTENPQIYNKPEDIIYIIYTSGTTGMPKGVSVTHRNVIRLIKNVNYVNLSNPRILQTGSLAFDASTFEIWGALLNGGMVCITNNETLTSPEDLRRNLRQHNINTLFLTTALFNQMVDADPDIFTGLRELFVGGEKMSERHVKQFREVNKETKFSNIYGPTESTTFAIFCPVPDIVPEHIPLGKPITNTTAYVMRGNTLCGIGILGELCIGGDGVAKGYINSEQLTVKKFVVNPFEHGKMLYRTGDLVCLLPDGNIDYMGRTDHQVKIRGFRIEPDEIVKYLLELNCIQEAFVLVRKREEEKYLCAYVVVKDKTDAKDINAELRKKLPEYMIPPYIVFLDALPLNKNGKVDKEALPEPDLYSSNRYAELESEKEIALARIFEEVLGAKRVGALDSFYELGGDSIKAIRIMSKYRVAGYRITVKDIMTRYTVRGIASMANLDDKGDVDLQDEVYGEVVKTPILHSFEQWNLIEPNKLVQCVMMEIKSYSDSQIKKAFDLLVSHHDMLRAVYKDSKLVVDKKVKRYEIAIFNQTESEDMNLILENECRKLQTSLMLQSGPLISIGYFRRGEKSKLFMCIHHLVVDGVSWRILLEDLGSILNGIDLKREVKLAKKTTSYIEWSKVLEKYKHSKRLMNQKEYWLKVSEQLDNGKLKTQDEAINPYADTIVMDLDQNNTEDLLRGTRKAFSTENLDLLLSALSISVFKMTGQDHITVNLEGHGREDIDPTVNISRTVGWFTSLYPVILECSDDIEKCIISTKEILHHIPDNGIGYGLVIEEEPATQPSISFNYLGELEEQNNTNTINICNFDTANENEVFQGIAINGYTKNKCLSLSFSYKGNRYSPEFLKMFVAAYQKTILEVIHFCTERKETIYTPSDYSVADLTIADLKEIDQKYNLKNVSNIYSLTSLQEGMLFEKLSDSMSTGYVVQQIVKIKTPVNRQWIENAIHLLAYRYDVLRTAIIYERVHRPVQVVLKEREIELEIIDLSNRDESDAIHELDTIQKNDVYRGFDLQNDSLLRIKLIYLPIGQVKMIWCFHHIIMDGWCMTYLYRAFVEYYEQLCNHGIVDDVKCKIEQVRQHTFEYGEYLNWLASADDEASLHYWSELLNDFQNKADIPSFSKAEESRDQVTRMNICLPLSISQAVNKLSVNHNTTMNSILETALGILLMKYNHVKDVVFGKVVSGRDIEITGIEEMVGLFVNTIPVRMDALQPMTVSELIATVNQQGIESQKHSFCSLAKIQKNTISKGDLFHILFVFENYYADAAVEQNIDGHLYFEIEAAREQTEYPLTIAAYVDEKSGRLQLILMYNPAQYVDDEIHMIADHYVKILELVSENVDISIDQIQLITNEEKLKICNEFNTNIQDYPRNSNVIQLFEEQVGRYPDHVAVIWNGKRITYKELDKKANQLANRLEHMGVNVGDYVAIAICKSIEMLVAICAVLKVGAAYIPLDLKNPKERIDYILEDCKPILILEYASEYTFQYTTLHLEEPDLWKENSRYVAKSYAADELAYVMYTSGTTGRPKGSMITNRGIVRLVKNTNIMELDENITILQTGSIAFDAATFEIWGALLNGGKVVLTDEEILMNPVELKKILLQYSVNTMWLTSTLFNQIIQMEITVFDSLKTILVGGEKLSEKHIHLLRDHNKEISIINGYGPTENTTFTTTYQIPSEFESISIGRPISQTQVYIMDDQQLCGIGIPGELCIAGDGLSKGYLNQKELTEEKFTTDPFGEGRIYHSGDLACWQPDGNICYLGRIDDQVKLRGFRIEPQEITYALKEQKGILDAITVIAEDESGSKAVHSYFVADSWINIAQLRNSLYAILPDYMIPQLMQIDKIPLTRNGKADRSRLPKMSTNYSAPYEMPRNVKEQAVCDAFCEVLGMAKVGINDNFFELGGDSIKAIRIVSLLKMQNYDITVKDVMIKHIVRYIAEIMKNKQTNTVQLYEQNEVNGVVKDTPIIKFFKNQKLQHQSQYNQDKIILIATGREDILHKVLHKVCSHHDILRAVFRNEHIQILPQSENEGYELQVQDIENLEEKEVKLIYQSVHESILLEEGPLLKAALLKNQNKNYLFLCAHHLVIDGFSWSILCDDIQLAIQQLLEGKEITLPPKTASFIQWADTLNKYQSADNKEEICFWKKMVNGIGDLGLKSENPESRAKYESLQFKLSVEETSNLLHQANNAYHTEVNDLLISALAGAIHKLTDLTSVGILMEGHGREEIAEHMDISRTIGWFTCMYPILVQATSENLGEVIISIKELFRSIPYHGIGYGVYQEQLPDKKPEVLFNYLGEIKNIDEQGTNILGIGGSISDEDEQNNRGISLNGSINQEQLSFVIHFNTAEYRKEDMQNLVELYQQSLSEIIAFCTNKKKAEKTKSDYTADDLEWDEWNHIREQVSTLGDIEDVYSLTPMQENMLLQRIIDTESTNYVVQEVFLTSTDFETVYLKQALDLLASIHDILRTLFVYDNLTKPRQVVLEKRELEFTEFNFSLLPENEAASQLKEIIQMDVKRNFDLQKDSLLRMKYVKLSSQQNRMIWTHHHIILDGWCMSLMFKEFFEYYHSLLNGTPIQMIRRKIENNRRGNHDFGAYVQYIQRRDKEKAMAYWKNLLQDYENVAEIKHTDPLKTVKDQVCKYVMSLPVQLSQRIEKLSSDSNITLSMIFKAIWGIVLQQYTYSNDVVFGEVVSGRNTEDLDVNQIIGLCINTIPVRIQIDGKTTVRRLLERVQQQSIESLDNSFCSLVDIESLVPQKNSLIKNLCVFENYYIDEKTYDDMNQIYHLDMESSREQTDYALNIVGFYDKEIRSIKVVALYNPECYSAQDIERITKHIEYTASYFVNHFNDKIIEIDFASEEEKQLILENFNHTEMNYDREKTMVDLFEDQVIKRRYLPALTLNKETLSYSDLNEKANQVAYAIRKMKVRPNDRVVVMIDRSFEMIIAILGILKSGAGFVPVDDTYPEERIRFILEDCDPKAIIIAGEKWNHDAVSIPILNLKESVIWQNLKENLMKVNTPEDLAYVIYTSGTTGKPKGVKLRHLGVVNMRSYLQQLYSIDESDSVLQFANYVFDAFVWEFTVSLLMGAELVLLDKDTIRDVSRFNNYAKEKHITITLLPPQYYLQTDIKGLKVLTTGGSASNYEVVKKAMDNDCYINAYGPTENTVLATHWVYQKGMRIPEAIPIGKPMGNVKAYIMRDSKLCGISVPGELCITGESLAEGYLNQEELTRKAFINNPFGDGMLYKTGDVARWLPDGNIEYLGRNDEQVKIRGFRIEKSEIESTIRKLKGIKDAVVIDKLDKTGEKSLFAYFVAEEQINVISIRQELTKRLPFYMVPANIYQIETIPLTRSGKVNKDQLASIEENERMTVTDDTRNEYEKSLKAIWKDLLEINNISIFDNFNYIGGDSLKISKMFLRINKLYPGCLTIGDVFANPTIASLAEQIEKNQMQVIQIKQMAFPAEFFAQSRSRMAVEEYSHTMYADVCNNLVKQHIRNERELFNLLLFTYAYQLTEMSKSDSIEIIAAHDEECFSISEQHNKYNDLNELKKKIIDDYEAAAKYESFQTRVAFEQNGVVPVILYNTKDKMRFKDFCDFAIILNIDDHSAEIGYEIWNHMLMKDSIHVFWQLYITILSKIL